VGKIEINCQKLADTGEQIVFDSEINSEMEDEEFKFMVQLFFSWLKNRQRVDYMQVSDLLDSIYLQDGDLKFNEGELDE